MKGVYNKQSEEKKISDENIFSFKENRSVLDRNLRSTPTHLHQKV